jgi:hypothetical protein
MRTTWLTKWTAAALRFGQRACGLALVLAACGGVAWARNPSAAPEIDPGSMQAALMLLGGGVLLIADRLRRHVR